MKVNDKGLYWTFSLTMILLDAAAASSAIIFRLGGTHPAMISETFKGCAGCVIILNAWYSHAPTARGLLPLLSLRPNRVIIVVQSLHFLQIRKSSHLLAIVVDFYQKSWISNLFWNIRISDYFVSFLFSQDVTKIGDVGLVVWFSLWVREVPGSTPGRPRQFFSPPISFFRS